MNYEEYFKSVNDVMSNLYDGEVTNEDAQKTLRKIDALREFVMDNTKQLDIQSINQPIKYEDYDESSVSYDEEPSVGWATDEEYAFYNAPGFIKEDLSF